MGSSPMLGAEPASKQNKNHVLQAEDWSVQIGVRAPSFMMGTMGHGPSSVGWEW